MTSITVAAAMQTFLGFVAVFFVIYLIGYSTFLFLSVTVGSSFCTVASAKRIIKTKSRPIAMSP